MAVVLYMVLKTCRVSNIDHMFLNQERGARVAGEDQGHSSWCRSMENSRRQSPMSIQPRDETSLSTRRDHQGGVQII